MSKSKELEEQEAFKLDEYFKKILAYVRPYVLNLTSAENAQLCKVWLDKLNTATSQRSLRNDYLVELWRQLKAGHIGGIFCKPPVNGLLAPLPRSYHMVYFSSSLSELSDSSVTPCQSYVRPNTRCIQHQFRNKISRFQKIGSTSSSHCSSPIKTISKVYFHEDQTGGNRLEAYKKHINVLTTVIKELENQNEELKCELLEFQKNLISDETPKLHTNIQELTTEVDTLKSKLTEVQKLKDVLELHHKEIVHQYKTVVMEKISMLKLLLHETETKNESLNNNITIMAEKLEEIMRGKDNNVKELEKQWVDKLKSLYQQYEVLIEKKNNELKESEELIKQKDLEFSQKEIDRKQETELLINRVHDLENKLKKKIVDEDKLQTMLIDQCTTMKKEFSKMRNEMLSANQTQNQNFIYKTTKLKKTIAKLKRSNEKLGREYEKNICNIINNKDLEIKALKLQNQSQKNDIYISLSSEKQNELDTLVNLLEERYKALLTTADASAEKQQQEYLKKVTTLERHLSNWEKSFENSTAHI